jgi:cell division protein FtsI/penicillin-binding protein 2
MSASALGQSPSPSLYAQATSAILDRSFPSPRVEYLLLDLEASQTVALRWAHPEAPVPVGSLLKPFVALAYGQFHGGAASPSSSSGAFPAVHCHGKSDGCWRTKGHGSLQLEQALGQSCNAYFLALATDLSSSNAGRDAMRSMSTAYHLPAPPEPESSSENSATALPGMWIGVTPEWRISPPVLAQAYAELVSRSRIGPQDEIRTRLLAGMRLASGPGGTASKVGVHPGGVLAKTGTAPCVPDSKSGRCLANGDGLVVLLTPADHPRLLLLVRQRGTTGAETAALAGQMLTRLEEAHAQAR